MKMTRVFYGLAALPLLAGVALAQPKPSHDVSAPAKQPMQLSEQQMDKVTAGWNLSIDELVNLTFTQAKVLTLTFVAPLVAEDSAFQNMTIVTMEPAPPIVSFPTGCVACVQ